MRATVTTPFPGRKDGEVHPQTFGLGEVLEGDLAEVAVREGWAAEISPDSVEEPGTFDHDGDGSPGGSKPKAKRGQK